MKTVTLIILAFIACHSVAVAQSKEEVAVAAAVNHLTEYLLSGDRASLNAIAAEELSYGHSSGKIEDKPAFVEALASGASDFTKIDITDQTISIAGNVALVRHKMSADVSGAHVNLGILTVWTKQKGGWKLLARQAFRL